jgi:hypothetical protein
MPAAREYRHQPADSKRRGLPAIGFSIRAPERLALASTPPIAPDRGTLLTGREPDRDGVLGELEIGAFSAALIMDRDGILEQIVAVEADRALIAPASGRRDSVLPVELGGGASGYRADVVLLRDAHGEAKPRLPYLSFFALATADITDAGLFVSARSARPEWPTLDEVLATLRIVRMGGSWHAAVPAPTDDEMPHLPLLGRRR